MSGVPFANWRASDTQERASVDRIEAQKANEDDARHGEAGGGGNDMPADEPSDMISSRQIAVGIIAKLRHYAKLRYYDCVKGHMSS